MSRYVEIPIPNATRANWGRHGHPAEDVRALVRILRRSVIAPDGRAMTLAELCGLLNLSERTLKSYMQAPAKRSPNWRGIPYCTMVCLQALASNPAGVAAELWPATGPTDPSAAIP